MMQRLFAVYDRKAEGFNPPFSVMTIGQAERSFMDACQSGDSDLAKHPEDYSLYCVGEFNQMSGEVTPKRIHVANGTAGPVLIDDTETLAKVGEQ